MKSKHLLLMLLMAFIAPLATNAQETLTVCDGTTTNGKIPVNGLYVDTQGTTSEFIIPAETEGMSDMIGGIISKVSFYIYSIPDTWGNPTIQLYIGEVENTTLSSLNGPSSFTTVNTSVWSNQSPTIEVVFDEPYTYRGGNLLIGTYVQTASSTYKTTNFSGVSAENGASRYNNGSGTGTAVAFLPKTTFTYTDPFPKPASLAFENVNPTTTSLTWVAPDTEETIAGYLYEIKDADDDWTLVETSTTGTTVTFDELTPGTNYDFRVRTDYGSNQSIYATISFTTLEACMTPEDLAITDVTAHAATLNWTEGYGDGQWVLKYKLSTDEEYTNSVNVALADLPYTLIGLTAETTYNVQIAPVCDDTKTITGNFTTTIACPAPTGLASSNITGHGVTMTWTVEEGAWYQCAMVKTAEYDANNINWSESFEGNTQSWNNLDPETGYTFALRKDCSAAEDGYSQIVTTTFTTDIACYAPTGLTVAETDITANEATATWNGTSQSYVVMIGEAVMSLGTIDFEDQTIPSSWTNDATYPWVITNAAAAGGTYSMKSGNYHEGSSTSSIQFTATYTENTTLEFDVRCSCEQTSTSSDWDYGTFYIDGVQKGDKIINSTTFTHCSYEVEAGTHTFMWKYKKDGSVNGGDDCLYVDNIVNVPVATVSTWIEYTTTEQTYTFDNLDPETPYQVKVKGYCGSDDGFSQETAPVSFTTLASCPVPSALAVNNVTAHEATLTWAADNDSYNIMLGEMSYLVNANFETGDFSQADFTNGTYAWSVVANDHNGAFCAKSATGNNSATSTLELTVTLENDEPLTFSAKVSSESGYDKAYFYIDGTAQSNLNGISGAGDWIDYSFPLTAGTHTLSWRYTKDSSMASNDDCFYVDDIVIINGASVIGNYTSTTTTYNFTGLAAETTYSVQVQGVCGDETTDWSEAYSFTTGIACLAPTDLTAGTPEARQVELSWTEKGEATAWQICVNNDEANLVDADSNPFTLDNLTPDTDYTVKVRANCGDEDGTSQWSNTVSFHTAEACAKPTNLVASNVTTNSIDLTWDGTNDSYEVRYIESIPAADFENGFGAWTTIDADGDGFTWLWSGTITGVTGNNGSSYAAYSQSYDNDGGQVLYPDNYLVSPKVQLGGSIAFYACAQDASYPAEHFGVAVSTTSNTDASAFTTIQEWTMTASGTGAKAQGTWGLFTVDLSAYSGEGYVAIRHFNCSDKFYLDIDDITITMPDSAPWHTESNIKTNSTTLEGLSGNTTYAIQVRGYCEGETDPSNWTEVVMATTINGNVFTTTGEWNVASNWQGNAVPAAGSDVVIAADVTVPAQYVADAGMITFENSATITVADGGQLKTTLGGVNATMQKHLTAYSEEGESVSGWNFISLPVIGSVAPTDINGMVTDPAENYALYAFNLNCDGTYDQYGNVETAGTDGLEWRNYKVHTFTLDNGQGYLYGNSSDADGVDLEFTGEILPTNTNIKVIMHYDASAQFPGINLLGNPYSCDAYLADGRSFYVMKPDGSDILSDPGTGAIGPMQGIIVDATAVGNLNFTTTAPSGGSKGSLNINVMQANHNRSGSSLIDRTTIRFDEGEGLAKFQLNPNHTKIYIPQDGKDYAIINAEHQGEMPVNFKAERNGTYTISFSSVDTEFNYLHLIDNMTGNDVDLLTNPSYSFEAKTTDYASRFKLVYSTGNANLGDDFAFISNGEIILNGQGTAQVFDVTGRMISSHNDVTRISTEGMAKGVYVLRLINGTDVKTQKIVVK